MTDIQFSNEALEMLRSPLNGPGSLPPGQAWDKLAPITYIMGDHVRTHITNREKSTIPKTMTNSASVND